MKSRLVYTLIRGTPGGGWKYALEKALKEDSRNSALPQAYQMEANCENNARRAFTQSQIQQEAGSSIISDKAARSVYNKTVGNELKLDLKTKVKKETKNDAFDVLFTSIFLNEDLSTAWYDSHSK